MKRYAHVLLAAVVLTLALAQAGTHVSVGQTGPDRAQPQPAGPVAVENAQPGSTGWQSPELAKGRGQPGPTAAAKDAAALGVVEPLAVWADTPIRGYAELASVNKGDSIGLRISTTAPTYSIEVYRMGWYNGAGARLMSTISNLTGQNQAVPAPDANGMVEARWARSYLLATGTTWQSGVYLAKLIASTGQSGYIPFVVRDDAAVADIVFQVAVTTYQAYDNWGGKSLYGFNSEGGVQANRVSFNRPYALWDGAGMFFDGDYNFVRWLERSNYNVTYTTNVDTHTSPAIMNGRKVFLSSFHDEYWSRPMRDNVTAWRNAGKHLAWFGANAMYWQIRFENGWNGTANRTIVAYKESPDPITPTNPSLTTTQWRSAPLNLPENAVIGVMYESYWDWGVSFPWVVQNASHWVYTGTGLTNGAQIPKLVGYEYDKVWNNGQTPAGLTVLAASPVRDFANRRGTHNASLYTHASGAIVFGAGTIYWPWLLDDNEYQTHGADARVQRMTSNILNRMITGGSGTPTPTPTPTTTPTPTPTPTATPTPGPGLTVYDDALATGWFNDSSGGTVNLAVTSPVFSGTKAVSFQVSQLWGYFAAGTSTPVNTTGYTALSFSARAATANQHWAVWLLDPTFNLLAPPVVLSSVGGEPVAGAWTSYAIPLSTLGAVNKQVVSIVIQDNQNPLGSILYIDQIRLEGGGARVGAPAAAPPIRLTPTAPAAQPAPPQNPEAPPSLPVRGGSATMPTTATPVTTGRGRP